MAKELLVNVMDPAEVHTEGYEAGDEPIFLDEVSPKSRKRKSASEAVDLIGGETAHIYLQE